MAKPKNYATALDAMRAGAKTSLAVAAATGMSRGAAANAVSRLRAAGMIKCVGSAVRHGNVKGGARLLLYEVVKK